MKPNFTCLEPNDTIYVVYNKNFNNKSNDIIKYVIEKATVIENKETTIQIGTLCNFYNGDIQDIYEHYFIIKHNDTIYSRNYSEYYNNVKHMTICSPLLTKSKPTLEVFMYLPDAIEYVKDLCKTGIERVQTKIDVLEKQIDSYKLTIENVENEYER